MEFMGISVGILALICTAVLLFGVRGTRKILGWTLSLILVCAVGVGAVVWAWPRLHATQSAGPVTFDDLIPKTKATATPVAILPALPSGFVLDKTADVAGKIEVTGPDKRIFLFSAGTEMAAIESYMQTQYGAPGTPAHNVGPKNPVLGATTDKFASGRLT